MIGVCRVGSSSLRGVDPAGGIQDGVQDHVPALLPSKSLVHYYVCICAASN